MELAKATGTTMEDFKLTEPSARLLQAVRLRSEKSVCIMAYLLESVPEGTWAESIQHWESTSL